MNYLIEKFNYAGATREDYAKLLAFDHIMREERSPGDPLPTLDESIVNFQNIPAFVIYEMVVAWTPDRSEIVGQMSASVTTTEDNRHLAGFDLLVHPAHRQRGIANALFPYVVRFAHAQQRTLLITDTSSVVPAGEIVMEKIGAHLGLESKTNRLQIADLDRSLMERWAAEGPVRAPEFELGLWAGQTPDEDMADYISIVKVMNTAPRGTLQVEDWDPTPEQIRQEEASDLATGVERWAMYVRHKPSGEVAGFTEVWYRPQRAQRLGQGATGVLPKYRNHGLGRWLKGAMMLKVLAERPQVTFIDTGNADSNAPMLKINHEMGFKPHMSHKVWQFTVEQAEAYLAARQK